VKAVGFVFLHVDAEPAPKSNPSHMKEVPPPRLLAVGLRQDPLPQRLKRLLHEAEPVEVLACTGHALQDHGFVPVPFQPSDECQLKKVASPTEDEVLFTEQVSARVLEPPSLSAPLQPVVQEEALHVMLSLLLDVAEAPLDVGSSHHPGQGSLFQQSYLLVVDFEVENLERDLLAPRQEGSSPHLADVPQVCVFIEESPPL